MAKKRSAEFIENIEMGEEAVNEGKKFIALKTISILAGSKTINLVEGEEVKEISDTLAESLINSNLIK